MFPCKCLRVFVIHPDPSIASGLAMVLIGKGHSARFFTDAFQTLDCARDDPPDVLLAAISMPVLSGIELAILLREVAPLCAVILTSALASMRDITAVLREQGLPFELLREPLHGEMLLSKIEEIARRSLPFLVPAVESDNWETEAAN